MVSASDPRDAIIRAAGKSYPWGDVLAAGYFRGDAEALHERAADSIAALRFAEEQGFSVASAGEAAGEEFRLEHSLITGDEMDAWLEHCALSLEEFDAYFAGCALAERFESRLAEIRRDYAPTAREVVDALWPSAILSDAFEGLTLAFARRVAQLVAGAGRARALETAGVASEGGSRVPNALQRPGLLEDLAEIEACFAEAEQRVVPAERLARELAERGYQLTRVVVCELLFPSLDQANEAYQCVKVDGLDIKDVADRAGVEAVEHTLFAEEAAAGAAPLLSAPVGAAVEPEKVEDGFVLRVLRERIAPDPTDPLVRERARERLLAAHFDALVSLHVTRSFDPWVSS